MVPAVNAAALWLFDTRGQKVTVSTLQQLEVL